MPSNFFLRSFISLLTTLSFLLASITGIVLFIVPQGRVAYWTDWKLLPLSKTDWGNVHISACVIFMIAGSIHLYFNWPVFLSHLKDRVKRTYTLRKELAAAVLLSILVVAGSIAPFPPMSWLLSLNTQIKEYWVNKGYGEPPFGHAEQVSLAALARRENIDLQQAMDGMRRRGIVVAGEQETLESIAKKNKTSPAALFALMKLSPAKSPVNIPASENRPRLSAVDLEAKFSGSGIGRKTVPEVVAEIGLPREVAERRLAARNIHVREGETLKETAARLGIKPIDIVKGLADD